MASTARSRLSGGHAGYAVDEIGGGQCARNCGREAVRDLGDVFAIGDQRRAAGRVKADGGNPAVLDVQAENGRVVLGAAAGRADDRARRLAVPPEAALEQFRDREPWRHAAACLAAGRGHRGRSVLRLRMIFVRRDYAGVIASAAGTFRAGRRRRRSAEPPP